MREFIYCILPDELFCNGIMSLVSAIRQENGIYTKYGEDTIITQRTSPTGDGI
ncbi:hypothetical protein [Ruminiclostridium cellobioparum]|uniref:hypothetical protein n=1 Tax=Ruminiclostridium cellobioparum TaxID=29355 RepID=UPI0013F4AFAF|nr:hypothetical protein [Ruminiclostridium cellobioparum]